MIIHFSKTHFTLCFTVVVMLFCCCVSIASHKTCYSCRLEVRSSFTLLAYFWFFTSTLDLVCFPLLSSPCVFCSLCVFAGAVLAVRAASRWHLNNKDQSCFTAAVALTKAGEVFQMSEQRDVKITLVTGLWVPLLHTSSGRMPAMASDPRNRQQCSNWALPTG